MPQRWPAPVTISSERTKNAWQMWREDPATGQLTKAGIAAALDAIYIYEEFVQGEMKLAAELRNLPRDDFYGYEPITVKVDTLFDKQPGFRYAEHELRGVPVRVEIGPKDLEKQACAVARR